MAARKPRMCARCGNLVGSEDDQCPSCGLKMGTSLHGLAAARGLLAKHGSATSILVGFILVVYVIMVVMSGGIFAGDRNRGGLGSLMIGFPPGLLIRCGACHISLVAGGEPWRLITAMFVHGGILHVAFNAFVLLQLGRLCELYYDRQRTFVIFVASGFFGFLASALSGALSVGASGAIMGLAGAVLAKARVSGGGLDRVILTSVGRWVFIILIIGFLPGLPIDGVGHIGGLIAGAVVGHLLIREGGLRSHVHFALFGASVVLTVVCVALGVAHCIGG